MEPKTTTFDRALDLVSSTPFQVLLAGLVGGVLRWLTTEKGWKGGVASILSGLATAWYFGPPLAAVIAPTLGLDPNSPRLVAGSAFFVGVGGISIVALVVSVSKSLNNSGVATALRDALVHFLTRGGPRP